MNRDEDSYDRELMRIRERKIKALLRKTEETTKVPIVLTDASFQDFINKQPLAIIDCWAAWCGPCRILSPIINKLAEEFAGKVAFGKLNVDENQIIPSKHGIMSIPTLLIFKEGHLTDRIVGVQTYPVLKDRIIGLIRGLDEN